METMEMVVTLGVLGMIVAGFLIVYPLARAGARSGRSRTGRRSGAQAGSTSGVEVDTTSRCDHAGHDGGSCGDGGGD